MAGLGPISAISAVTLNHETWLDLPDWTLMISPMGNAFVLGSRDSEEEIVPLVKDDTDGIIEYQFRDSEGSIREISFHDGQSTYCILLNTQGIVISTNGIEKRWITEDSIEWNKYVDRECGFNYNYLKSEET